MDSIEVESTYAFERRVQSWRPYAWLGSDEVENPLQLVTKQVRSRTAVLRPPIRGCADLPFSPGNDAKPERQTLTLQLVQQLPAVNAFASLPFLDCGPKLPLHLVREMKPLLIRLGHKQGHDVTVV